MEQITSFPNEDKKFDLETVVARLLKPGVFMAAAAFADVLMTHLNIEKHQDLYLEWNPLYRNLSLTIGLPASLVILKMSTVLLSAGVAALMEKYERYKGKGKYLLYGSGTISMIGFLANCYFY